MKKNRDYPKVRRQKQVEEPEWFRPYLVLKYKLTTEIPERFGTLGPMTVEDIADRMLHKQYPYKAVRNASIQLVRQGLLTLCYKTEDGLFWDETFGEDGTPATLARLKSGDIFNKQTGERYTTFSRYYTVSKDVLDKIEDRVAGRSVLQKIRDFLRWWD